MSSSAATAGQGLGLRLRGSVAGPEQTLVDEFLLATKICLPAGRRLTVFAQPAIETGFPDLVAVVWRSEVARTWAVARERLRTVDLRLLHLIATKGSIDLAFLQRVFRRGLLAMLNRLEEANVVVVGKSKCRALHSSRIFAVERIIAVEAKISAQRRLLEQAGANTWFSSESHALLPTPAADGRLRPMAEALGVGVLGFSGGEVEQIHAPAVRAVPLSYGSWLFNEWAWRVARQQDSI